MKLLVTGGLGFIGSNFIRYVLNKYPQYSIINLDKKTYAGNPENLKDIEADKRYEYMHGDICDTSVVENLVPKCDVIINFAAESHVDRSIEDADPFLQTNIIGTHNLLKANLKFNKKMIHISTDEVYGSVEEGSFTENSPIKPNSPYSASKAGADLLCRAYIKTHKANVIIARSSNNYGPYQYPEKIIPLFVTNLMESKKVPVYGSGNNVRDWLFVLDNVSGIDVVLHKGEIGQIYNISSNNELSNIMLTKKIISLMDKDESSIEYIEDRKGHDLRYSLDSSKLRSLGWAPEYNLEQGLKMTIDWYQSNESWWKSLK